MITRNLLWIVLPIFAAVAGLLFLPAPFPIFFAAPGILGYRLALGAHKKWAKVLLISAGSFAAMLAVAELVMPNPKQEKFVACHHASADRPDVDDAFDGELGFGPPAGTIMPTAEMPRDPEYDGVYTIGENGLRIPFPSDAQKAILFFGGSYTFGYRVKDDDATPHLVGKALVRDYRCYNFGFNGYGVQQMLAALESGYVDKIVDEPPRFAFFQLINHHVRRAVGRTEFSRHDPRYVLDENGVAVRAGRMCDPRPEPSWLMKLLARSAIYHEVRSHTLPGDVDILIAMVVKARDEIQSSYPGCEFHVILWDKSTWKVRSMKSGLTKAGVRIHLVTEILPGYAEDHLSWFLSREDHHPTPEANVKLCEFIVDTIHGALGPAQK